MGCRNWKNKEHNLKRSKGHSPVSRECFIFCKVLDLHQQQVQCYNPEITVSCFLFFFLCFFFFYGIHKSWELEKLIQDLNNPLENYRNVYKSNYSQSIAYGQNNALYNKLIEVAALCDFTTIYYFTESVLNLRQVAFQSK